MCCKKNCKNYKYNKQKQKFIDEGGTSGRKKPGYIQGDTRAYASGDVLRYVDSLDRDKLFDSKLQNAVAEGYGAFEWSDEKGAYITSSGEKLTPDKIRGAMQNAKFDLMNSLAGRNMVAEYKHGKEMVYPADVTDASGKIIHRAGDPMEEADKNRYAKEAVWNREVAQRVSEYSYEDYKETGKLKPKGSSTNVVVGGGQVIPTANQQNKNQPGGASAPDLGTAFHVISNSRTMNKTYTI